MTRSTIKNPIKPFEELERGMDKKRRVACLQQRNESLYIAGRNLFDEGPSFFPNQILRPRAFESIPPLTHPGLYIENPIHHIKHFLSVVDHIKADGATRDASRLCFFHFTLKGKAKEWLDKIPPGTITSWEQIVSKFLDKFFPPECTARIRDKILQFRQSDNESIKDAWKCFQDLLHQAPHHGIKKWLLVQLFYDNMIPKDKEKLNQFTQFRFSSLVSLKILSRTRKLGYESWKLGLYLLNVVIG
ncbi:reverse transcriptase domain-containing protein [Tanacetum coccineum]